MNHAIYVVTVTVLYTEEASNGAHVLCEIFDNRQEALSWMNETRDSFRHLKDGCRVNMDNIRRVITNMERKSIDPDKCEPFTSDYRVQVEQSLTRTIWLTVEDMESEDEAERRAEFLAEDYDWDDCDNVVRVDNCSYMVVNVEEDDR